MNDVLQQALEALASQNGFTRAVAVACADWLVYLLGVALLVVVILRRDRLSLAVVARFVVLVVLAYVLSKILAGLIIDPRPYIVTHTAPLTQVSSDNGFPSDHTLLAASFTAALWWFDRRILPYFAAATLVIMAGRMAIGAHHTLDVVGSIVIVAVALLVAVALPLPASWNRPLLPQPVALPTRQR